MTSGTLTASSPKSRQARRRYLMCPPSYFRVDYSINPWMEPAKPVDTALAVTQWQQLYDVFVRLGHIVDVLPPDPELPDMVYTANGGTVVDGRALVARFHHAERAPESALHLRWLAMQGFRDVRQAEWDNEGEGDYAFIGGRLLAGSGFRSDPAGHAETAAHFGVELTALTLVDPRFYHLDTALAVLDDQQICWYPPAFDADSQKILRTLFPDAIEATWADAEVFGLNAVSDGRHVVLPHTAVDLIAQLRDRGYDPIGVDLSELLKGGGGVKCCTLELRERPTGNGR